MEAIAPDVLAEALEDIPAWGGDVHGITCTIIFKDFRQAMAFMQRCIEDIERLDHHPEWSNVYHTVMITLRTHDADNKVSEKDLELARLFDQHATAILEA